MTVQNVINFSRRNVFSSFDNEFFTASGHEEVSVFIHPAKITGSIPVIGRERFLGRRLVFEVPLHHVGALYLDFTLVSCAKGRPEFIGYSHIIPPRNPGRAHLLLGWVERVRQNRGGCFGDPHGFNNRDLKTSHK